MAGTSQSLLPTAGISSHPEDVGECWLQTWRRRREQRLCSPRLGGERSSGILEVNSDLESITAGAIPALGVMDAPQAPSLISILLFLITGAASCGAGEPQQREGQHSTLIARLLLDGIIPIASALGAELWGGTSSHFTPGGVFTFAKAEGSSGSEFCRRGWRIRGLDAAEGNSGVTLQPWRLGAASFPPASGLELIRRAFQRFPGVLDPQKVGLSVGREENCTVLSPPGLCDTEDAVVGQ